ncbi:hypothetical protein I317_03800 [Kwoniella heveanensis CBS 569]|nr:hypothetical protein I317_03800 [Kwoniella heveanensis CBS 569]
MSHASTGNSTSQFRAPVDLRQFTHCDSFRASSFAEVNPRCAMYGHTRSWVVPSNTELDRYERFCIDTAASNGAAPTPNASHTLAMYSGAEFATPQTHYTHTVDPNQPPAPSTVNDPD